MTNTKKPIDVKIPPKDKGKPHKPGRTELETRFINYYMKHGYAGLRAAWDDIGSQAKLHGLNVVYLAAYLMKHGGIPSDVTVIGRKAAAESKRLYRTKGRDPAVRQMVNQVPGMKNYFFNMGGTWGGKEVSKLEKKGFEASVENPVLKGKNGKPITDIFGTPLRVNDVRAQVLARDDLFRSYVGRSMTRQEAIRFARNHWSDHKIASDYLTKLPGFFKSDIWKSNQPVYLTDWETVYGVDASMKPSKELIRQAILRGTGGEAWFNDEIRKLPQYKKSVEYKHAYTSFAQQYNQIIGHVDEAGQKLIDDAIMGRHSAEEFIANLRSSAGYGQSVEQRSLVERDANAAGIYIPWHEYEPTAPTEPTKPPPEPTTTGGRPNPPGKPKPPYTPVAGKPALTGSKKRKPKPRQHPAYGRIPVNARSGI